MPSGEGIDFDSLFADYDSQDFPVKSEAEEEPVALNALITLDEFLNADYDVEQWSKTGGGKPAPDPWFVASIAHSEQLDKRIQIRLPLQGRRVPPTSDTGVATIVNQMSPEDADVALRDSVVDDSDATDVALKSVKLEEQEEETTSCKRKTNSSSLDTSSEDEDSCKRTRITQPTNTNNKMRKTRKARTYKYDPKPLRRKDRKIRVPEDLKNDEYWENRKRNNEAAKKSRLNRRVKELEVISQMDKLRTENNRLREEVERLSRSNAEYERRISCS